MTRTLASTIVDHFAAVEDPRIDRNKRHALRDILTIAICGVICGAETWVEIAAFGRAKLAWFQTFLDLPNGIPSHDTFGRVFRRLDPKQMQACFVSWVEQSFPLVDGQVIAVDGKALRGSHDKTHGVAPLHMVSAWAAENRLVLGQLDVDDKSNEITAIPVLLAMLDLTSSVVTIDAMGCQKAIAAQIIDQGGEYVLALKRNHSHLYQHVQATFAAHADIDGPRMAYHETMDTGHGREETRRYWITSDLDQLEQRTSWRGLQSIGMVERTRRLHDKETVETHYFLGSILPDALRFGDAVRTHWQIENRLHWVLDVEFAEDASRVRVDHGPQNLAVLRHIALNAIRTEPSRGSIKTKRLTAGWNNDYLARILANLHTHV